MFVYHILSLFVTFFCLAPLLVFLDGLLFKSWHLGGCSCSSSLRCNFLAWLSFLGVLVVFFLAISSQLLAWFSFFLARSSCLLARSSLGSGNRWYIILVRFLLLVVCSFCVLFVFLWVVFVIYYSTFVVLTWLILL